jgi:phosphate transport system substrate-binding protein
VPGAKEEESFIVGERSGVENQIEIQAHGSKTAFEDLKSGLCDIGMASRPIKPEERQALLPTLGDLTSNASEHVLALDGIALIVHPSNPIKTLSVAQVADIFSGTLTDWSQLGGRAVTIAIYARDEKSGTWDFFNEAVLKKHGKTNGFRCALPTLRNGVDKVLAWVYP